MRQLMAQIRDEKIRTIEPCDITVEEETRSEAPVPIKEFRAAVGDTRLACASPAGKPEKALCIGRMDPGANVVEELLSCASEACFHLVKSAAFKVPSRKNSQKGVGVCDVKSVFELLNKEKEEYKSTF
jgi:hypothetical protein